MPLDPARFDAVFLDLDDTLADTTGTLIPAALRRSAAAMIDAGLGADETALHDFLTERAASARGGDYFIEAAAHFGAAESVRPAIVERGRAAYFRGDVAPLRLLPGARELLDALAILRRYLITAGDPATQRAKIAHLRVGDAFDAVRCVDTLAGDDKGPAMRELLASESLEAARCLCVGDRVVSDVRHGNELGMVTVWMRRGEFKGMQPTIPAERPDHVVASPAELHSLLTESMAR